MICKTLGGAFIALKIVFKMNKKSKKLWGLKVGGVEGEKKEKNMFCKLEILFLFLLFFHYFFSFAL
jgi:hypothetical protein